MCELFYNEHLSISEISKLFYLYIKYEKYLKNKDITHKTYNDIKNDINSIEKYLIPYILYNKDNIILVKIENYKHLLKYINFTKWCINKKLMYEGYSINHKFYIMQNNNLNETNPLYIICFEYNTDNNKLTLWDKDNNQIIDNINDISKINEILKII